MATRRRVTQPDLHRVDINNDEQYKEAIKAVNQHKWDQIKNPFSYAKNGTTEKQLVDLLIREPEQSGDVYTKIENRGKIQSIFRETLLRVYGNQCAFTKISFVDGLQAAHIKP